MMSFPSVYQSESSDCLFCFSHVRATAGPLMKGKVLVDSDSPEALTSLAPRSNGEGGYLKLRCGSYALTFDRNGTRHIFGEVTAQNRR
jgi:hypothetical protein